MNWWLYVLVFVFGYLTCKTFYFFRTIRMSLSLLRMAQVIYLSTIIKSLEYFSYSKEITLEHMLKTEKNSAQISSFQYRFSEEERLLKTKSIDVLGSYHTGPFRAAIEFKDWTTAMEFLTNNRDSALNFWRKND